MMFLDVPAILLLVLGVAATRPAQHGYDKVTCNFEGTCGWWTSDSGPEHTLSWTVRSNWALVGNGYAFLDMDQRSEGEQGRLASPWLSPLPSAQQQASQSEAANCRLEFIFSIGSDDNCQLSLLLEESLVLSTTMTMTGDGNLNNVNISGSLSNIETVLWSTSKGTGDNSYFSPQQRVEIPCQQLQRFRLVFEGQKLTDMPCGHSTFFNPVNNGIKLDEIQFVWAPEDVDDETLDVSSGDDDKEVFEKSSTRLTLISKSTTDAPSLTATLEQPLLSSATTGKMASETTTTIDVKTPVGTMSQTATVSTFVTDSEGSISSATVSTDLDDEDVVQTHSTVISDNLDNTVIQTTRTTVSTAESTMSLHFQKDTSRPSTVTTESIKVVVEEGLDGSKDDDVSGDLDILLVQPSEPRAEVTERIVMANKDSGNKIFPTAQTLSPDGSSTASDADDDNSDKLDGGNEDDDDNDGRESDEIDSEASDTDIVLGGRVVLDPRQDINADDSSVLEAAPDRRKEEVVIKHLKALGAMNRERSREDKSPEDRQQNDDPEGKHLAATASNSASASAYGNVAAPVALMSSGIIAGVSAGAVLIIVVVIVIAIVCHRRKRVSQRDCQHEAQKARNGDLISPNIDKNNIFFISESEVENITTFHLHPAQLVSAASVVTDDGQEPAAHGKQLSLVPQVIVEQDSPGHDGRQP